MNHLSDAVELKRKYPKETDGFDIFQVERIWEEHSGRTAAGWMTPDKKTVEWVFESYRV